MARRFIKLLILLALTATLASCAALRWLPGVPCLENVQYREVVQGEWLGTDGCGDFWYRTMDLSDSTYVCYRLKMGADSTESIVLFPCPAEEDSL